jgi:hypothetical protein
LRRSDGREDAGPEVRTTLRTTGLWCAIACAALAVVGAVSSPLVHWSQDTVGWKPSAPQERAWFTDAPSAARGFKLGSPASVGVGISLGMRATVQYSVRSDGQLIQSGTLTGAGTTQELNFTSIAFVPGWLTISVQGLTVPLRLWVHT